MVQPIPVLRPAQADPLAVAATPWACGCQCDTSLYERELQALRPEQRARFAPTPAELLARRRANDIERAMRLAPPASAPFTRYLSRLASLVLR